MIRMHVVRASHLLTGLVSVFLLLTLAAVVIIETSADHENTKEEQFEKWEAEASFVSASAIFAPLEGETENDMQKKPVRVLIYHTHTHEAYLKKETDEYIETSAWRTKNNQYNIVRVGEELADLLTQRGFYVIHDTTDHELTDLSTAYTRSLETMKAYEGEIDLYIDLHRDAYHKDGSGKPFSVKTDNEDLARLMFLVGNGKGFSDEMHYTENYELATLLTGRINDIVPGLCRPVMVKDGRYNQHISDKAILVEVGHNQNSIEQAIGSMKYLADALKLVLQS